MTDAAILVKSTLDGASLASGTRNYCGQARQSPTAPYTVIGRISDIPENTLSSGVIKRNVRLQIDVYAEDYDEAVALQNAIVTVMEAAAFTNVLLLAQDLYDDDVRLHRVLLDYSLWL